MNIDIIYEDKDIMVLDKPAGINADDILKRVHRLDKDTSGILLAAKNDKTLEFLQKQFQERRVKKKYIALVTGNLKNNYGVIETLIGRSPKDRRKQKAYLPNDPEAHNKREAVSKYKVLQRFSAKGGSPSEASPKASAPLEQDAPLEHASGGKDYTLIEVEPKTGRKHQIRCHFVYLGHPITGDKLYGFKNQPCPAGLTRQFLHAQYLKIKLPGGEEKEFKSELPEDLKIVLEKLKVQN